MKLFSKTARTIILIGTIALCKAQVQGQNFWTATEGPFGQSLWTMLVTKDGDYYAGTGDGKVFKRIFGQTAWTLVYASPSTSTITILSEHPNGSIYVGDDDRIVKSADGESNWTELSNQSLWARSMAVANNGDVYFGTKDGIFRSQNDGPLEPIEFDLDYNYGKFIFSMITGADGTLYAGTAREIYKTVQMDQDTVIWAKETVQTENPLRTFYNFAARSNGDIYVATGIGLFANYANDGIDEWVEIGGIATHNQTIRNVEVTESGRVFININGLGVLYSDNDATWTPTGLSTEIVTRPGIFHDQSTNRVVVGSWNGVWSAPYDDLTNFQKIGLPPRLTIIESNQPKMFVIEDDHKVLESLDAGETWSLVTTFTEGNIVDYCEIGQTRYMAIWGGLLGKPGILTQHEDDGDFWFAIGFPSSVTDIYDIYHDTEGLLLASTNNGLYYVDPATGDPILRSTLGESIEIRHLAEDNSGNLIAGTTQGVFISPDHGETWPTSLMDGIRINAVAVSSSNELFIATPVGLSYHSDYNDKGQMLGDDVNMVINQNFDGVVIDGYGHLITKNEGGIYYAENINAIWQEANTGLSNSKYLLLHHFSNVAYIASEFGLFKHQEPYAATILLEGLESFEFNGQAQGNPTATTIPEGLTVDITFQAGASVGFYPVTAVINDPQYYGKATGNVIITKAFQTIQFDPIPDKLSTDQPFVLTANSDSGLPVIFEIKEGPATVSGSTLTLTGEAGVVKVLATQPGSNNYWPAKPITRVFEVLFNEVTDTEEDLVRSLRIYPNPASKNVTVESLIGSLESVTITNFAGQVLDYIKVTGDVPSINLDLSSYADGLLLIRATKTNKENITRRIQLVK